MAKPGAAPAQSTPSAEGGAPIRVPAVETLESFLAGLGTNRGEVERALAYYLKHRERQKRARANRRNRGE